MSPRALAYTLASWCLLTACVGTDRPGLTMPPGSTGMSSLARTYLDSVVKVMELRSINRFKIDWADFRVKVNAAAPQAQSVHDTYPAITTALGLLGDGHSQYRAINGIILFVPLRSCVAETIANPIVPSRIGYVRVPSFSGSAQEATNLATTLQTTIRLADRDDLHGWIVDLRGNGGGNMWPMIAGVGPVLGEGLIGWFIGPDSSAQSWAYSGGASRLLGQVAVSVTMPHNLKLQAPRVAVLIDGRVASSGEATAIAFKGRPNTRFFGAPTCFHRQRSVYDA